MPANVLFLLDATSLEPSVDEGGFPGSPLNRFDLLSLRTS